MQHFIDIVFAKITIVLIILLNVIYLLRKLIQRRLNRNGDFLVTLNIFLRKHHKLMGVFAIILGLGHGLLSSYNIFSLNSGTFCWSLLVLLGASWYYKSKFLRKGWLQYHRILAVLLIATLFLHVTEVEALTSNKKPITDTDKQNINIDSSTKISSGKKLKDGVYTGNAAGLRPGLVVQVTISNGVISSITIISHNEKDPKHYSEAMRLVPERIIAKQSTDVDGVSGATKTSNGIKNAVNDALAKAVNQ